MNEYSHVYDTINFKALIDINNVIFNIFFPFFKNKKKPQI